MLTEDMIEKEVKTKGLTAPRLTPKDITDCITNVQAYVFPNTSTTIVCLTLKNGFTVVGTSSCVSRENFDRELGHKIAFENARDKIWELEGYRLQNNLMEGKV